jgi:hypothetical protein
VPPRPESPHTAIVPSAFSTSSAFAALKADRSIKAWGDSRYGGTGAPLPEGDVPPESESPHAVIEPSVLRAAKALKLG